ncbi:MAG TPA: beta-ketoacyl synthase N-terminal-like domain-containing protein, partial [Anaerolineaceae bacterium]
MTRNIKESSSNPASKRISTPIAVIGISSLFPQARSTQEYWDNILRKIDCISDIPASRWSIEDYYDPDPSKPDKTYSKRGGFIPDVDFDPMEFGLPPNILEVTDVSQLLSLVVARDALEDAGYGEERQFDRENTGCVLGFVGTASKLFTPLMTRLQYPVWEKVLRSAGLSEDDTQKIVEKIKLAYVKWEENSFPGAIGNVVAGRVCNRFDLGGVNCVVDAACASSLAAIKMAVSELIEHRANMMITGGVDTDNSINTFMCFSKTPAFTKKDMVRPFDAESGGMLVGEGLGMVVLKRLEDAERDGDRVYAVIHAIGTSSDGRFKSIYAPRPSGQAIALRRAYDEAGFPLETVGLIEAHGTGTMAGDPAEFAGLVEAFGEKDPRKQHIALGSVKSQIAHTKAAAGVASLIKTSLALYHKVLPPSINVSKPNPKLNIENTPFYINSETRPWIRAKNGAPRRAGVSSFGFGGTNYHVVLQEHEAEHTDAYRLSTVAQPVLLAAKDTAGLVAACREALQSLQGESALVNFYNLAQSSRALEVETAFARVGFVAETVDEARQALQVAIDTLTARPNDESWENPKGIFYRKTGLETKGKVVALFSGQGSQYLEMGRELAINFPAVREVFGAMDDLFIQDGLEPLSSRVYPKPVFDARERDGLSEALTRTEHAQPAIGSVSVGLYKLLQQAGFQSDFVAGHSFGELTALWAGGVISEADYYTLAKARGKAMAPPADAGFDAGTMVAVKGDVEKIRQALQGDPEVTLANWNSNDQMVIAGSKAAMSRAQETLAGLGFKTIPLTVSAAFHTPLVGHAQKPFAKAIQSVKFHSPKVRVYSNSTAQPHSEDPKAIQALLAEHILNPVLFRDEIQHIYDAGGTFFVEFGPKNVLTNLVDNILAGKPHLAVALNANVKRDSDRQLREAVTALRVAGLTLKNFDPYQAPRKAPSSRKKSPVTVKLNGGYYVSEKTRSAFEVALKDGFRVSQAAVPAATPAPAPAVQPAAAAQPAPAVAQVSLPVITRTLDLISSAEEKPAMNTQSPIPVESALVELQAHQSETLRLHEQYLRMEEEYARAFAQMTQLQSDLVARAAAGDVQSVLPLFESLERSMTRFHEHQAETLRIHQHYLENQERFSQSFVQSATGYSVPAAAATAALAAAAAPVARPALVRPVVAATAALAAAVARPVAVPPAAPVEFMAPPVVVKTNGSKAASAPQPAPAPLSAPVASAPVPAPASSAVSVGKLKDALLQIVSEKTGYPVETLELEMDMEADLGIDSIKRVEILGAMQTQFAELPKVEAATLAELRTLGQIVDQFSASVPAAPAAAAASAAAAPAMAVPAPSAASLAAAAPAATGAM